MGRSPGGGACLSRAPPESAATTVKAIGATDARSQSVTAMPKFMVEPYTRPVDQEALALSAVRHLEARGR